MNLLTRFMRTALTSALALGLLHNVAEAAVTTLGSGTLSTTGTTPTLSFINSSTPARWTPSTVNWSVVWDDVVTKYTYTYTWTVSSTDPQPGGGFRDPAALSHFTLETSGNLASTDITTTGTFNLIVGGTTTNYTPTVGPDGSSPKDDGGASGIYGIKWTPPSNKATAGFTVTVTTAREPIWSDIYIKDGNLANLVNSSYVAADPCLKFYTTDCSGASSFKGLSLNIINWGWVAAPDTGNRIPLNNGGGGGQEVPEPATLLLLSGGLIGLRLMRKHT